MMVARAAPLPAVLRLFGIREGLFRAAVEGVELFLGADDFGFRRRATFMTSSIVSAKCS